MENGNYTVTPYLDGYKFSATSTDVTVNGASVTGIDFSSTFNGYSVSGNVTRRCSGQCNYHGNRQWQVQGQPQQLRTEVMLALVYYNGSYTITPSLKGYKFTPYSQSVSINSASVTGIDFVSALAHASGTAFGTYIWNATTEVLSITWTNSTLPCNWPKAGAEAEIESGLTITETTMTWPGIMVWTRTSGSTNDPAGTWTATTSRGIHIRL